MVTGRITFVVAEAGSGKLRAEFAFAERLAAIDIDEESLTAVVATGAGISFVDLRSPEKGEVIPVPSPRPNVLVGQVRFVPGTRKVLVGYGVTIFEYDRDARAFGDPLGAELTSDAARLDRSVAESVSALAFFPVVEMRPDPARDRLMLFTALDLAAVSPDGQRRGFERDVGDTVLGLDFVGPGPLAGREIVSVVSRRRDAGLDLRLSYIGGEKPLTYETFRVSAADLGNEQLKSCKVSRANRHLACTYTGKTAEGLLVWHIRAGHHPGERVLDGQGIAMSAAPVAGDAPRMLTGNRDGLTLLPGDVAVPGVEWDASWRLVGSDGAYAAAYSPEGRRSQLFRVEDGNTVRVALAPVAGRVAWLQAGIARALVIGEDRLTLYDLRTGRPVWALPGLAGLRAAGISPDGSRAYAATSEFAYAFDGPTGRIAASFPLVATAGTPAEIDAGGARLASVGPDGPGILDLATGQSRLLPAAKSTVTQFVFPASGGDVVMALDDGSVVAAGPGTEPRWTIAPPAEKSFQAVAMPGQSPRGSILQLAASPRGQLAIVRQDMPTLDLHDVATGQLLTQLTPPINLRVPAAVAFDAAGRVASAWAAVSLTVGSPHAVTMHALPITRGEALVATRAALAATVPLRPDGLRRPADAPGSN